jgi:RNA polymerase sigma-70 factor (ECF subfamily)
VTPPEAEPEDGARVAGYLRGEAAAFGELDGWIRVTLRRRYPGLAAEHEDLAQAVHGKLFESLREGRYAAGRNLRAYVTGIVHHSAIDRLRELYRRRVMAETLALEPATGAHADPYRAIEALDDDRLLYLALLAVPAGCRELWRLMFVEQLTYEQIGERLAIPAGTVKSRMWHCRRKALAARRRLSLLHRAAVRRGPDH